MPNLAIRALGDIELEWGESACWDDRASRLYFVDCLAQRLGRYEPATGAVCNLTVPSLPTALYLDAASDRVFVQLDDGIYAVGETLRGLERRIENPPGERRFNDGTCDPEGGIVTGTLLFGASDEEAHAGSCWRWRPQAGWRKVHGGLGNTNGPCFSLDGRTLYFADSTSGVIHRFDYDGAAELRRSAVFADVASLGGVPDGATVDAEGYLWTTVCGAGRLARYSPDGALDRIVELPASHPTSIAFGGERLDVAYVTTIGANVVPGVQPTGELAGALLVIRGLGVQGQPRARCRL